MSRTNHVKIRAKYWFWVQCVCYFLFVSCTQQKIERPPATLQVKNLAVLIDSTRQISLERVCADSTLFSPVKTLNIQRNPFNNWVRFEVENKTQNSVNQYLLVDYISVEQLDFYEKTPENKLKFIAKSGWQVPVESRPIQNYLIVFPISLKASESKQYYFKANALYFHIKADLMPIDQAALLKINNKNFYSDVVLLVSMLTGVLFCLINALLNIATRRETILYMVGMLLTLLFSFIKQLPHFYTTLIPALVNYSSEATIAVGNVNYLFFAYYFTKPTTKEPLFITHAPRYFLGFALMIETILFMSFFNYQLVPAYFGAKMIFVLITYPAIVFLILYRIRRSIFAKLLLLSSVPLLLYFALYMAVQQFGIIDIEKATLNSFGKYTIIIDVYLLIFGIFYKQRRERMTLENQHKQNAMAIADAQTEAKELERKRLAQDLHDDLGGTLLAIKWRIASETSKPEIVHLVEKAIEDVRLVSRNLLNPDLLEIGLSTAVRYTVERLQSTNINLKFDYLIHGEEVRFLEEVELNIYRIVSECFNNILKHSKATEAKIILDFGADNLIITIEDNGIGFDMTQKNEGIGLKNIKTRAENLNATLEIMSNPQNGTQFTIAIPY